MTTLSICHRCPHRQRRCDGKCLCLADDLGLTIEERANSADCPKGFHSGIALPVKPTVELARNTWGPPLWRELHLRPYVCQSLDGESQWMVGFTGRIPCGPCRKAWLEDLAAFPADYSSRDAYFAWTVAAHNRANVELGRPEWTVEQARANLAPKAA